MSLYEKQRKIDQSWQNKCEVKTYRFNIPGTYISVDCMAVNTVCVWISYHETVDPAVFQLVKLERFYQEE